MKKKFNILDLFIVLFVVCLIAFIAVRFTSGGSFGSQEADTADYEIVVRDIKSITADAIPDSGKIYDDTGVFLGTVTGKEVRKAQVLLQTHDGSYDIVENADKYDVTVKATASGVQKTEGFFFEGKKSYGVGSEIFVDAGTVSLQGKVLKMEVTDR